MCAVLGNVAGMVRWRCEGYVMEDSAEVEKLLSFPVHESNNLAILRLLL